MIPNRVVLCVLVCLLVFTFELSFAMEPGDPTSAAQSGASEADREILKMNADCNAAELRADVQAMDNCEITDFTHTHASGKVEPKAEYLKGIGTGAHKFLALDLSEVHVRSYSGAAIVDAHLHLRANNNGHIADVEDFLTIVWVNQQGNGGKLRR